MVVLHGYIVAGATKLTKDEPSRIFTCIDVAKCLVRRWIKISLSPDNTETPPTGTHELRLAVAWLS